MSSWRLVILIGFFVASIGAQAEMRCEEIFTSQEMIARAIHNLAELRIQIDTGQANGVSGPSMTSMRSAYISKETQLVRYLEDRQIMTAADFSLRIKSEITKAQRLSPELSEIEDQEIVEHEHKEAVKNYRPDGHMVEMVYLDTKLSLSSASQFTEPFMLAPTLTTQIVWRKVVNAIQKKYPARVSFAGFSLWAGKFDRLNPNPSKFNGDLNPIEQVSFKDVDLWIIALNELSRDNSPLIQELFPDHRPGTVYRLPRVREYALILDSIGVRTLDRGALAKHSWYADNSGSQTHPVATKEPSKIDGENFYDLVGNVMEMTAYEGGSYQQHISLTAISLGYTSRPFGEHYTTEIELNEPDPKLGFRLASNVP
jgi:hypothetical protein